MSQLEKGLDVTQGGLSDVESTGKEDTIFIFEKFSGVKFPDQWSRRVLEEIHKNRPNYIAHSTRAYKLKRNVFVTTEMRFRRSKNSEACRSSTDPCIAFDDKYNEDDNESAVSCMIYDRRQLYLRSQFFPEATNQLFGAALLSLNNELFKFKETHFPMTRFLYGESSDVSRSQSCTENSPFSAKVKADFVKPDWFEQHDSGRIVVPGTDISDVIKLHLSITNSQPIGKQTNEYRLTKVYVELQELTSFRRGESTEIIRKYPQRCLRRSCLLERKCNLEMGQTSVFKSDNESISQVPSYIYRCKVPEVGPTTFRKSFTRTYGIKIILFLKHNGQIVETYSFSEISIAMRSYQYLKRHLIEQYSISKFVVLHCLTLMERFAKETFVPGEESGTSFRKLCEGNIFPYKSHQTDTFMLDGEVVSVTKVDLLNPCEHDYLSPIILDYTKKFQPFPLGHGPFLQPNTTYIICEVVNAAQAQEKSASAAMVGGLFLHSGSSRISYEFPLSEPISSLWQKGDCRVASFPFQCAVAGRKWLDLSFVISYKHPSGFMQPKGQNVALPGMRLSDFLDLRLRLPGPEVYFVGENQVLFTIKNIRISIYQNRRSGQKPMVTECKHLSKLVDKEVDQQYTCADFDREKKTRWLTKPISPKFFDCSLPQLGPTLYTSEIYRGYEIGATIKVRVSGRSQSEQMHVRHAISIACEDVSRVVEGPLPPSYEEITSDGELPQYEPASRSQ